MNYQAVHELAAMEAAFAVLRVHYRDLDRLGNAILTTPSTMIRKAMGVMQLTEGDRLRRIRDSSRVPAARLGGRTPGPSARKLTFDPSIPDQPHPLAKPSTGDNR
jgi:hypothetical protein